MATNVKTGSMSFPYPLGKLVPGQNWGSRSVPVTQNVIPVANDGVTPDYQFNNLTVLAGHTNTGKIYICNSAANPDKVGYSNVIYVLSAGLPWVYGKEWANNRDISKIYIGADNTVDFATASIDSF